MDIRIHRGNVIQNTATMAYRNLLKTIHNPDQLMDVVIQPVLFMLMFGYLFGGANQRGPRLRCLRPIQVVAHGPDRPIGGATVRR